jgi:hypothetical protein
MQHPTQNSEKLCSSSPNGYASRSHQGRVRRRGLLFDARIAFSDVNHYPINWETGQVELRDDAPAGALGALKEVDERRIIGLVIPTTAG